MKKRVFTICCITTFLASLSLAGCSSGSDEPSGGNNNTGGSGNTSHIVPSDPDSGNNNNSKPDNIKPGTSGTGDNTNPGENTGSGGSSESGDNAGSSDNSPKWKLVFEDNFGTAGDTVASAPDSEYWSLAQKGTDTWNRYMSESYDQAFQKGGYLYLYGEQVDGQYQTGGIESRNKFDFEYGQMKCRARFLRQPQGNHTGIWMMPETQDLGKWPRSGEIDVMEHLDDQGVYYSTVHYFDNNSQKDASSDKDINVDNNDFNIYGVVWTKDAVSFTLNGNVVFTYKNDDPSAGISYQYPFQYPFYLILSQSLGGRGTWEGVIDNSELPAIFQIDWIKVWQGE